MTDTAPALDTASRQAGPYSPAARRRLIRLVIIALLMPLSFELVGIRLTPSLVLMIGLFPVLLHQYLTGVVRWRLPDLLFILYVFWQALTILLNNPERFVAFTGQQTLSTVGVYLAGRLLILNREDFISFVLFWAGASMLSVPFALYESVWDDPVILRLISDHTPFSSFAQNNYEPRLGLFRAQFVFTHPIHYGLMGAMILMLFWHGLAAQLSSAKRSLGTALIFAATFLSVSSGAVLSVLLQAGIFVMHRAAGHIGSPWRVLLVTGGLIYSVLELLSTKSAFVAVSGKLAFNSGTAYYRTLIWEYGSAQVLRTPVFGNGYNYWPRPHWMLASVDNHWLLMALVHGLPALILIVASLLYAFFAVNRASLTGDRELDRMRLSWTLALIGFCMSASTVAIWGEIQMFFMLLFGAGFWLADTGPVAAAAQEGAAEPAPRHLPYTRFPSGRTDIPQTRRQQGFARDRNPRQPYSRTRT